jgi:HK97 family phage portal protein
MSLLDTIRASFAPAPDFTGTAPDTSHIGRRLEDPAVAAGQVGAGTGRGAIERLLVGGQQALSQDEAERAYRSTVFFLANYRARNFARHLTELAVERRTGPGEFEPVEEGHPWLQLLRRPNDYMPPLEVWQWALLNRDLWYGAHFAVEHGPRGVPVALHPIFPSYGSVTMQIDGRGALRGWRFDRADGQQVSLAPEDVIRVAHESPFERGRATTLIEAAAYEIDQHLAQSIYARDAAEDQGMPEVILEAEEQVDPADGNRISRLFAQKYRSGNRRGVPWTSGGLEAKQFQLSQRDQQFFEMTQMTKSQLYEIFEVQESLFSDQAYATGMDGAFRAFALNTVQPNVEIVVSQLEHGFERIFEADPAALRIAVPDTVPTDRKLQAELDDIRIKNGTRTINEARRRDGNEEVDGGDEPLVGATVQALDMVTGETPDGASGDGGGSRSELLGQEGSDAEDDEADRRARLWRQREAQREDHYAPMRRATREHLGDIASEAAAAVRGASSGDEADTAVAALSEDVRQATRALFRQIYERVLPDFASEVMDKLEDERVARQRAPGDWQEEVDTFLDEEGGELIQGVSTQTLAQIIAVVRQGVEEGEGTESIAKRIEETMPGTNRVRARRIARTEVIRASNKGALEGARASAEEQDLTLQKEWIATADTRTRDDHEDADGQTVGLEELFEVGAYSAPYPAAATLPPSQSVNCRCTHAFAPAEDDE